ncbi:hypothetical protein HK405_012917, partial [Cladochytrium tenue]
ALLTGLHIAGILACALALQFMLSLHRLRPDPPPTVTASRLCRLFSKLHDEEAAVLLLLFANAIYALSPPCQFFLSTAVPSRALASIALVLIFSAAAFVMHAVLKPLSGFCTSIAPYVRSTGFLPALGLIQLALNILKGVTEDALADAAAATPPDPDAVARLRYRLFIITRTNTAVVVAVCAAATAFILLARRAADGARVRSFGPALLSFRRSLHDALPPLDNNNSNYASLMPAVPVPPHSTTSLAAAGATGAHQPRLTSPSLSSISAVAPASCTQSSSSAPLPPPSMPLPPTPAAGAGAAAVFLPHGSISASVAATAASASVIFTPAARTLRGRTISSSSLLTASADSPDFSLPPAASAAARRPSAALEQLPETPARRASTAALRSLPTAPLDQPHKHAVAPGPVVRAPTAAVTARAPPPTSVSPRLASSPSLTGTLASSSSSAQLLRSIDRDVRLGAITSARSATLWVLALVDSIALGILAQDVLALILNAGIAYSPAIIMSFMAYQ